MEVLHDKLSNDMATQHSTQKTMLCLTRLIIVNAFNVKSLPTKHAYLSRLA